MKIRKIVASGSAHATCGRARQASTSSTRITRVMRLKALILLADLISARRVHLLRLCGKPVHESCKNRGEADSEDFSSDKLPDDSLWPACGRRLRAPLRLILRNVRVRSALPSSHKTATFCERASLPTRYRRTPVAD